MTLDDQASRSEELFLAQALAHRQQEAQRHAARNRGAPGRCLNCHEACLPTAVYCDEDCRLDHEARERACERLRGT